MRFILRKRNITVLRDSFSRYYGRHLRVSFSDGLYRRVRQGELSEGQEKVLWGTTSYPSGYLHKIGKEWKALHSPLFLMFNSALQWTPPALQVLAQLVSLFALGC